MILMIQVHSKENQSSCEGYQLHYDDLVLQTLSENNQLLKAEIVRLKKQHADEIKIITQEYESKFAELRKTKSALAAEEILHLKEEVEQERKLKEIQKEKYGLLQTETNKLLRFKKEAEEREAAIKNRRRSFAIAMGILACFFLICFYISRPNVDQHSAQASIPSASNISIAQQSTAVNYASAPKATKETIHVWIPANGKRYHDSKSCAGSAPRNVSLEEAKRLGYTSCGRCKPPY